MNFKEVDIVQENQRLIKENQELNSKLEAIKKIVE